MHYYFRISVVGGGVPNATYYQNTRGGGGGVGTSTN